MKITKKELRKIIREEARRMSEASREAKEGALLGDLSMIMTAVQEIAKGMYGLIDPSEPGDTYGDELAGDLEMQVERLNQVYTQLEAHFQSMDKMV